MIALGLAVLVFYLLPTRLPPARNMARPDAPAVSPPQAANLTGDSKAQQGLDRAQRPDEVRAQVAAGETREIAGKPEQARATHAAEAAKAPEPATPRAAPARVEGRPAVQNFEALMTRGLGQLERSEWPAAEQTFSEALKLRPADRSATDGLARAKDGHQRATLVQLQQEAQTLESAERWEEALAAYRRAAAIDPAVDFAQQGASRTTRMIQLHAQASGFLASPERLYSPRVREEAQQLLAALEREAATGPRIAQARQQLGAALKRATTRITVRLASDNATEVTLFRVGQLGRFQEREIALTPGTYTVVGSRPGYRDVRIEVIVAPDAPAPQIFVACKEPV